MKYLSFLVIPVVVWVSLSCKEKVILEPGDELTNPHVQPKVLFAFPPLNTKGPYDGGELAIWFNKIMDRNSVLNSLRVISSSRTIRVSSGQEYLGEVVLFSAYDSLSGNILSRPGIGRVFTVAFAETVKDYNGNKLPPGIIGTWEPEPFFRVRSVQTNDGNPLSLSNRTIQIYFNSPVDSEIVRHISITPELEITRTTISSDSMSVSLRVRNIIPSTQYLVSVSPHAHDKYGNSLPAEYLSFIHSEEFKVEYVDPLEVHYLFNNIFIRFTSELDTGTIRQAFNISPQISYELYPSFNAQGVSIIPREEYKPSTRYTLIIDTTLRSKHGVPLSKPFTFSFMTPEFRISSTFPGNNDTGVSRWRDISVGFTSQLDTGTIRSSVNIDPSIPGEFLWGLSSFSFRQSDSLQPSLTYTVTIDTSLSSIGGLRLAEPYSFSFTTRR